MLSWLFGRKDAALVQPSVKSISANSPVPRKRMDDRDIAWRNFNKELLRHATDKNMGLYVNVLLNMGIQLRKEEKHGQAVRKFLEVLYLDASGPCNSNGAVKWTPETTIIAPGVVEWACRSALEVGYGLEKIEEVFMQAAEVQRKAVQPVFAPAGAWKKIKPAISVVYEVWKAKHDAAIIRAEKREQKEKEKAGRAALRTEKAALKAMQSAEAPKTRKRRKKPELES